MAEQSTIEWTDATWNPITGCTLVSEGCRNCYAATLAATRLKNHPSRKGLARMNASGEAKFTGEVRFNEQWLDQPLRWSRPRMIFVCAHGDLFHESVPDEWIDRVFAVMALAPQHIFQVVTKRPERAQKYIYVGEGSCINIGIRQAIEAMGFPDIGAVGKALPNVWLGTSVEDQATADERIPHLLATPAAIRFVSAEPLLGPLRLDGHTYQVTSGLHEGIDWLTGQTSQASSLFGGDTTPWRDRDIWDLPEDARDPRLHWIIVGGESGPKARVWTGFEDACRDVRDQCRATGTAFFMKQMAGRRKSAMPPIPADLMIREFPVILHDGRGML